MRYNFIECMVDILFGIEYETIVFDKEKVLQVQSGKELDMFCEESSTANSEKDENNSKSINMKSHLEVRKHLTKLFNSQTPESDYKHKFVFERGYHGKKCALPDQKHLLSKSQSTWIVTYDQSVHAESDECPVARGQCINNTEFVSPPIKLVDELSIIHTVIDKLMKVKGLDYIPNKTASNHVHMTCGERFKDAGNLVKICMAWLYFEDVFMALCQEQRRDNMYARPMCGMFNIETNKDDEDIFMKANDAPETLETFAWDLVGVVWAFQGDPKRHKTRYKAFNLQNLFTICTVECRLKECCSTSEELTMWVLLLAVFYCRALSNDCLSEVFKEDKLKQLLWYGQRTEESFKIVVNLFFSFINCNFLESYWRSKLERQPHVFFTGYKGISDEPRAEDICKSLIKDERLQKFIKDVSNVLRATSVENHEEETLFRNIKAELQAFYPNTTIVRPEKRQRTATGGASKKKSKHFLCNRNVKELQDLCAKQKLKYKGLKKKELIVLLQSKRAQHNKHLN